jgi:CheY-like chemotaxis protein
MEYCLQSFMHLNERCKMRDIQQDPLARLLVVDDEPSIRTSMSQVLTEIGYSVRSAQDGFSALAEIQKEIPEIILSDLNMPGMSGFELLSLVRRRYPAIRLIAMSGAFSGDEVPSGVAADAFYQKGSGVRSLLKIISGFRDGGRIDTVLIHRTERGRTCFQYGEARPESPDSSSCSRSH